jgi:hypothetical protein
VGQKPAQANGQQNRPEQTSEKIRPARPHMRSMIPDPKYPKTSPNIRDHAHVRPEFNQHFRTLAGEREGEA